MRRAVIPGGCWLPCCGLACRPDRSRPTLPPGRASELRMDGPSSELFRIFLLRVRPPLRSAAADARGARGPARPARGAAAAAWHRRLAWEGLCGYLPTQAERARGPKVRPVPGGPRRRDARRLLADASLRGVL